MRKDVTMFFFKISRFFSRLFKRIFFRFSRPEKVKILVLMENKMGLIYQVFLPTVVDSDVVKRELEVKVDGVATNVDLDAKASDYLMAAVKDNANVELRLRDTDDAGNVSDWSDVLTFTAIDTIFPARPNSLSVKLVSEVADVVTPTPEPTPAPEPAPEVVVEAEPTTEVVAEPEVPPEPNPGYQY